MIKHQLTEILPKHFARLALTLLIGLALLCPLTTSVHAQDPVDLEVNGDGATSWNIGNIKPGDSGSKTVTLYNAGYKSGTVIIWISDIVNNEGINPESETGNTGEPGELGNYLLFSLSCPRLNTNLSFPTTIGNIPQIASGSSYIKINPINAGETINLDWQWELPPQTGNDVQGDSLSFTINYILEESPPAPFDNYDIDYTTRLLEVDILDTITWLDIRTDGTITHSHTISDASSNLTLEIKQGAQIICSNGKTPTRLTVSIDKEQPATPESISVLSPLYDFAIYTGNVVCEETTFEPSITLTISYDPDKLPCSKSSAFIVCYDKETGLTTTQPSVNIEAKTGEVKAEISHFSSFAIVAELSPCLSPASPPASFQISDLVVNPGSIQLGQPITIGLKVTNSSSTAGVYELRLKIDGIVRIVQEIALNPNSSETISFEVFILSAGHHQVEVDGLRNQFNIVSPAGNSTTDWFAINLTIAIIVIIITGMLALIFRQWKVRKSQ